MIKIYSYEKIQKISNMNMLTLRRICSRPTQYSTEQFWYFFFCLSSYNHHSSDVSNGGEGRACQVRYGVITLYMVYKIHWYFH